MARDVFLDVAYDDAGPFRNIKRYMLIQQMANDGSDMGNVLTQMASLIAVLDSLTWDHIAYVDVVVRVPQTGTAANIAANNSVEAFHRFTDDVTGKPAHLIVPAWDDAVYDKLPNGALSAAYNSAAETLADYTRNPATGNAWTYVQAQNRSVKRGQRQFKP